MDYGEPGALLELRVVAHIDPDLARLATGLPWFVDGLTGAERDDLDALREIVSVDLDLARLVVGLPWFLDGATGRERSALDALGDIASDDADLGIRLAGLPWLADSVTDREARALSALRSVTSADLELAKRVAALPWLVDDVTEGETGALSALGSVTSADVELAKRIAALPWLADELTDGETDALYALRSIAPDDIELARQVAGLAWFTDDVTENEGGALYAVGLIASDDPGLANQIAGLPWFLDGMSADESGTLLALRSLIVEDVELARDVSGLAWFTDGAAAGEVDALRALRSLAVEDVELARDTMALPWFADGVTEAEADTIRGLRSLALRDVALARDVGRLPWFSGNVTEIEREAIWELRSLALRDVELARDVGSLSWFADGVTEHEGEAIMELNYLASDDVELARRVAGFSWLADDVTALEARALTVIPTYALRTWDFTDSDGDGMTDTAETRYGFDPNDASSFPVEPVLTAQRQQIQGSRIGAHYEVRSGAIDIKWTNPEDGSLSLFLRTADSSEWDIYYGGHYPGWAPVKLSLFDLSETELLVGQFSEFAQDRSFVRDYPKFFINLNAVDFPDHSTIGNPSNRLGYTFSSNFPEEAELQYREFLTRVFPIMYERLGPPAETLDVFIEDVGYDRDGFTLVGDGRTLLTDAGFVPRLIVHEFVHAWNGGYGITSDEHWDYDDALSGFEEGIAEGMAFEIIHEYVRSYPTHSASIQLLEYRPFQYWSLRTTSYDAIKNVRWTGAGDFWTHTGGQRNRYSIAATTVQMMVRENPDFAKEFMAQYYEVIREDPDWRPNRDDVVDMWAALVPELNGYPLRESLDALPVFNGRKLDEGVYVLEAIRSYGEGGDQQFAVAYAIPDGRLWWGVSEEELEHVPEWIRTSPADGGRNYIDTQGSSFTVEIFDAYGEEYAVYNFETDWDRDTDGTPTGFGWYYADELELEKFPVGLYKETVTFIDYVEHDGGARETHYFFGLEGFEQDRENEYVIMIGVDGVPEGSAEIVVDGGTHTAPIDNGVAIFRSTEWPFDMQGRFPITITNAESVSRSYYRTLLEAGTSHSFFQHQFIIVDTDFDGVEDQFE